MSFKAVNSIFDVLRNGTAIPAMPLALNSLRKLDERRQRALIRYYVAAGAGGLAAGVHTTQFEIRESRFGLHRPVLQLVAEELNAADSQRADPMVRVAGICGPTQQAVNEATLARELGYQIGLISLAGLKDLSIAELVHHCRTVADVIPLFGFYLQPAVGGRDLPFEFWRRFAEIPQVVAVKIAAFDRYKTSSVVRAIAESGRDDIALYTGNDDSIVVDLLTQFRFRYGNRTIERRIVGGLLGQWAVWTHAAVELFRECRQLSQSNAPIPAHLLTTAAQLTDANAAVFDAANNFRGCIVGIHEVLRRQGLLDGTWCLDETQVLCDRQAAEIDRVCAAYPHLTDDDFVRAHVEGWLRP